MVAKVIFHRQIKDKIINKRKYVKYEYCYYVIMRQTYNNRHLKVYFFIYVLMTLSINISESIPIINDSIFGIIRDTFFLSLVSIIITIYFYFF